MHDIEKLEATLWEAADNLRANSHKSSSEYCMPVLGVIFLRHATNRYDAACREIAQDQAAGRMPRRPLNKADFLKRRALMLPSRPATARSCACPPARILAPPSWPP
jgi:type I restriction enzyme M protein